MAKLHHSESAVKTKRLSFLIDLLVITVGKTSLQSVNIWFIQNQANLSGLKACMTSSIYSCSSFEMRFFTSVLQVVFLCTSLHVSCESSPQIPTAISIPLSPENCCLAPSTCLAAWHSDGLHVVTQTTTPFKLMKSVTHLCGVLSGKQHLLLFTNII